MRLSSLERPLIKPSATTEDVATDTVRAGRRGPSARRCPKSGESVVSSAAMTLCCSSTASCAL
jgi:hypothetical protein